MIEHIDRAPTKVGRVAVYDEDHVFLRYEYHERADEPTQTGTPLNKPLWDEFLAASGTTAGSVSALTLAQSGFSLFDGAVIRLKFHASPATNATLNVQGSGAKPLQYLNGQATTNGYIKAGTPMTAIYDASADAWIMQAESGHVHVRIEHANGEMVSEYPMQSVQGGYAAAAQDGSGGVLVCGGSYSQVTNLVDYYSPEGVRSTRTPLSQARHMLAAATDGAGNAYFAGGTIYTSYYTTQAASGVVESYAPDGVRTTRTGISAMYGLRGITDLNGNVIFGGGAHYDGSYGGLVGDAYLWRYSTTGARTTLAAMSQGRYEVAFAQDGDGNILTGYGRYGSSGGYNLMDKLTPGNVRTSLTALPSTGTWTAVSNVNGNAMFILSGTIVLYDTSGVRTVLSTGTGGSAHAVKMNSGRIFAWGPTASANMQFMRAISSDYVSTMLEITTPVQIANDCFALDGNGKLIEFSGAQGNVFTVAETLDANIPTGARYRFKEHTAEQVSDGGTVQLLTPNEGYVAYNGSATI